jgi:hypothetical protein
MSEIFYKNKLTGNYGILGGLSIIKSVFLYST